jgi:ribonuclease BN (tRNA processing enzyme)
MKITVLGSGGWFPSRTRHTSCFLAETNNSLIILDAGTGLCRLGDYSDILNKYDDIHIIFSHYHLDHLIGLSYLPNWTKEKRLNIYGPGKNLGFNSCESILSGLLKPPYFHPIEVLAKQVIINDFDPGGFNINGTTIKITEQIHSGKSYGITVGNILHYATDTIPIGSTFKAAENTELLLHDGWILTDENNRDEKDHSSIDKVISLSAEYNIKKTGLIHLDPNWDDNVFIKAKQLIKDNNIVIVEDGMCFNL